MAVSKPTWLRQWLDRLNWDIFTWKVYVGDAIERGIDWALGWVNWGIDQASLAYNKALEAWLKVLELARDLGARLNTEILKLTNKITTWWSDLGDWWSTKVTWIRDLVAAASNTLRDLIDDVKRGFASLSVAWDNFRRDTLPNLLSRREAGDLIDTEVTPVRDEVNKHTSWLDLIKELFTDPQKWLLDQIEKMLARFL